MLAKLNLRARREALYLTILDEALVLFEDRASASDEFGLNRELYQCIIEVMLERGARGVPTLDIPPVYDGPNAPLDEQPTSYERKRPDLRWEVIDHDARDLQRAVVPFVIECKRLGRPVGKRVLTELYATTGIHRFVHEDWSYGRNAGSGVMIGYVQNGDFSQLFAEVNAEVGRLGLPDLCNIDLPRLRLQRSEHTLERGFALSPYKLLHMWVDIAGSASQPRQRNSTAKSRVVADPPATG